MARMLKHAFYAFEIGLWLLSVLDRVVVFGAQKIIALHMGASLGGGCKIPNIFSALILCG